MLGQFNRVNERKSICNLICISGKKSRD